MAYDIYSKAGTDEAISSALADSLPTTPADIGAATAAQGALADATTVEQVTLTAPLAYTLPTGTPAGVVHRVVFTQDGTGGHTVTYGGNAVTVDTTAGASTLVEVWPGGVVILPGDVATAAQGAKADAAVQPEDLGTAAAADAGDFATAAQGAKADAAAADILAVNIERFGAVAADISKADANRNAIQQAIDYVAAAGGGTVIVPARTYYISIAVVDAANGAVNRALTVAENVTLKGTSRTGSVLQLVSASDRYYRCISMHSNAKLSNLTIKDDPTNNQQPTSVGIGGSNNHQGLVGVIGKDVSITDCDLYNSSTWCVYADDTAKTAPRRDRFTMAGCRNWWLKRDWYATVFDVSQVYCKIDTMHMVGNAFYTSDPNYSRTVFDLEGTNITVSGNETLDFVQPLLMGYGSWTTDNATVTPRRLVEGNHFVGCKIGVLMYPYAGAMSNVSICGNRIMMDVNKAGTVWDSAGTLTSGISVSPLAHATILNLEIADNHIEWTPKTGLLADRSLVSGIGLYNGSSGGFTLTNCKIHDNTLRGFPFVGVSVGSRKVGSPYETRDVSITDNSLTDNGYYEGPGKSAIDSAASDLDFYWSHIMLVMHDMYDVDVSGNIIRDTGATAIKGAWALSKMSTSGTYGNVRIGDNVIMSNTGGLGSMFERKSNLYQSPDGLPMYENQNTGLRIIDRRNNPLKFCWDKAVDVVNYDKNDILVTSTGNFKADNYGTTGTLTGVTVGTVTNTAVLTVSDATFLRAGNVLSGGASVRFRVGWVKGTSLRVNGTPANNFAPGGALSFYNGLNATKL